MTTLPPSPPQSARYRPQFPWPAGSDVSFGESGLMVTRSSAGARNCWFFMVRDRTSGAVCQGEGPNPNEAEIDCYARFRKANDARATHRTGSDVIAG